MKTHTANPILAAYTQATDEQQREFEGWVTRMTLRRDAGIETASWTLADHYRMTDAAERSAFVRWLAGSTFPHVGTNTRVLMAAVLVVMDDVGITWDEIMGDDRTAKRSRARMLISGVMRHITGMSFPELAGILGRPNHSAAAEQCGRFAALPASEQLDYVVRTLRVAATMRAEAT